MRKPKTDRHPATAAAIKAAGGVYETANRLGLSAAAVSKWRFVPVHHVPTLAAITGLAPDAIRPPTQAPGEPKRGTNP